MSVIQKIQIKLTSRYGRMPTRGSECSAGYDLHAAQDILIPPKGKALIKTNLQIALPAGTYGRIAPRSGLALKHGIDVGGGVVDADYRGDVAVVLFNLGEENFQISVGDKVAQLICQVIQTPVLVEVEELPSTIRGNHGFGSTDISDREENVDNNTAAEVHVTPEVARRAGNRSPIMTRSKRKPKPV